MEPTWRALTRQDIPAVVAAHNAADTADQTGAPLTAEMLAETFTAPRFDVAHDSVSVWLADRCAGYGSVGTRPELLAGRVLAGLGGIIAPDFRGRGLGQALLDRLEHRAAELATERFGGSPLRLRSSGGRPGSGAEALLRQQGYRVDNVFVTMHAEPREQGGDPAGADADIVAPLPEHAEATRLAHNDAFRDHRNHTPADAADWAHGAASATARPALSRLAMSGDRVLAYALAAEYEPGVAHVDLVGTRREARGRGLARQVLAEVLSAAHRAGYRTVELEVDQTSPTGADRLYERIGFAPVRVISRYIKDV